MAQTTGCLSAEPSYVCGSSSEPLQWRTCLDDLRDGVQKFPDKIFVKFRDNEQENQDLTYGELDRKSNLLAISLHKLGLKRGDHVACFITNCAEVIILDIALYKLGCVVIRIQISLSARNEMTHVLKTSNSVALIYHHVTTSNTVNNLFPGLKPIEDLPELKQLWGVGANNEYCLESLVERLEAEVTPEQLEWVRNSAMELCPSDIMCACMTSGSTGFPKIVLTTHFAFNNNTLFFGSMLNMSENAVTFSDRSFSHASGPLMLFTTLRYNASMVYMRRNGLAYSDNSPDYIPQVIASEGCTTGMFFAYLLHDIIHKSSERDRHKIRQTFGLDKLLHGVIGGQVSTISTMETGRFIVPGLCQVYGSSEVLIPMKHLPEENLVEVGTAGPFTELSVRNGQGQIIARGEQGEIWFRGYSVFPLYYGDPVKTEKSKTPDGWFKTGDVGVMNSRGVLTVLGRINDMIIRATHNFYPLQFEQIIQQHPGVAQVAVIGVPDERLGEEICACVVRKRGQAVTEAELRQQFSSASAGLDLIVPKYFLFLDDMPNTNIGKTDRALLKKLATEKLSA